MKKAVSKKVSYSNILLMKSMYAIAFVFISSLFVCCKKEYSYEGGKQSFVAEGSLLDSGGNCMEITVFGKYLPDSSLASNNYIEVQTNITLPGSYLMYTDTVNGYYFRDSGTCTHTGLQTFKLRGSGTPVAASATPFTVHFDTSVCSFVVAADSAIYTFDAPGGSCPIITVNGIYHVGATLNDSDFVSVPVTVLQPGGYSIQTVEINNMQFFASGIFTNRGRYVVKLHGKGKPAMKEENEVPLLIGGTICNFTVPVLLDTTMYWTCTVAGTTYAGLLDSDYRALPDTGLMFGMQRVFGCQMDGGDESYQFTNYTFNIVVSRLNTSLLPGVYTPGVYIGESDFDGTVQLNTNISTANGGNFYNSDYRLGDFTVHLLTYDKATKLIEATFSGSVYKTKGEEPTSGTPVFQMTNGYFKTYMAYADF